jgi:hypothetical protein
MVKSGGATVVHNESKVGSYAYRGNEWVSFENTFTIREKVCSLKTLFDIFASFTVLSSLIFFK